MARELLEAGGGWRDGTTFTVTPQRTKSELALLDPMPLGRWVVSFATDGRPSRIVLARWGGLSLRAAGAVWSVWAWNRLLHQKRRGLPRLVLDLSPLPGGAFLARCNWSRRKWQISCPYPPRASLGLLWPRPDRREGFRRASFSEWSVGGEDLLSCWRPPPS